MRLIVAGIRRVAGVADGDHVDRDGLDSRRRKENNNERTNKKHLGSPLILIAPPDFVIGGGRCAGGCRVQMKETRRARRNDRGRTGDRRGGCYHAPSVNTISR